MELGLVGGARSSGWSQVQWVEPGLVGGARSS